MEHFEYRKNKLYCEEMPVADAARRVGTPCYIYSQSAIERRFREFDTAFANVPHLVCYAVKANSNLAVLALLHRLGSGFDIVSGGELQRALRAGADPGRIVFSGVGKTRAEIDLGIRHGILQFNAESDSELDMLSGRAVALRKTVRVGLRVNPDVKAETHPYHTTGMRDHKFGVPLEKAVAVFRKAKRLPGLEVIGVGFHIGSQITRLDPFAEALERIGRLVHELRLSGIVIRHLDLGGGLGIAYKDETPPEPRDYARAMIRAAAGLDCRLLLEPGRAIVGNAGILVARVLRTKHSGGKRFVVVDAAMNDLIRPSLYGAYHHIRPETATRRRKWMVDVVGPVCETGDFLARDRRLPVMKADDLLAIMSAGAYGFVQSSNYNSRLRIPEVMVKGSRFKVIRRRERFEDIVRQESCTPL